MIRQPQNAYTPKVLVQIIQYEVSHTVTEVKSHNIFVKTTKKKTADLEIDAFEQDLSIKN